ncbi:hypothetical protein [Candidatus Nanohalovita haloferacivicina]|uniref:hypothetical protein n=1 Tax=Candidatus Nanohalovita haloferacivicina TaxID=2978046 RepID=UPI00325FB917|nr:hypothetical protein HBNXNv_0647 [Candidatus Nanohalobia archaeon BNXNv]
MRDLLNGLLGGDGEENNTANQDPADVEQYWRTIRNEARSAQRAGENLNDQAESLDRDSTTITDPRILSEHASNGAEHAINVAQGATIALDAHSETALDETTQYDRFESIHGKITDLRENLQDVYAEVEQYGDEVYEEAKNALETASGLDVEVELSDEIDWEDTSEIRSELREVETEYKQAANDYHTKHKFSEADQKSVEEAAESKREAQENMEGTMWAEEYEAMADSLEERAESGDPLTYAEKAQQAKEYASLARTARHHIGEVGGLLEETDNAIEASGLAAHNLQNAIQEKRPEYDGEA